MDLFDIESCHSISLVGENIFENIDDITSVCQDDSPYIGQVFGTLAEVETFYRKYAQRVGFEIRIKTSRKHVKSSEYCSRLYQCRKAGYQVVKRNEKKSFDQDDDEDGGHYQKIKRRRDCVDKTECKAKLYAVHNKKANNWYVSTLELKHNHEFVSPTKASQIQTHKNISGVARNLIETLNNAGIGASRMMNILASIGGGMENVGFSEKDIRNVVRDIRDDGLDSNDAVAAVEYLKKLEQESPTKFFYRIKREDDNRIASILWVDYRSIVAYENFGDVVTFDTTYRTNRYSMPFAPFTGVNHHYHSILFGFALLRDETEETFVWLFENWLEAMSNNYPTTIITDQDRAMSNAIGRVFPSSHHFLCTWHISNKFPEKLGHTYSIHPTFKADFNLCLFKSLSVQEFEDRWQVLMDEYDLRGHQWLADLYAVREKFVWAYTKRYFAAGMTTTSRSEGMNSFFDDYCNSKTGIKDFVANSQEALDKQYIREKDADYITANRRRKLLFEQPLEVFASKTYTKEIFRRFQIQLTKSLKLSTQKIDMESCTEYKTYDVYKSLVPEASRQYFTINHFKESGFIKCNCKMFEHAGMICSHILRFMLSKNVMEIPSSMIVRRWTIDANKSKVGLPYAIISGVDYRCTQAGRYARLSKLLLGFAAEASCSRAASDYVEELIEKERAIIARYKPDGGNHLLSNGHFHDKVDNLLNVEGDDDTVFEPIRSNTKGRKKSTRIKSGIEQSTSQKSLRKCAICGKLTNHDKRNHYKALGLTEP